MFSTAISRRAWQDSLALLNRVGSTAPRKASVSSLGEKTSCLLQKNDLNYFRRCCGPEHRSYSNGKSVQSSCRKLKNYKWENKRTAVNPSQRDSISGPGQLWFAGACFGFAGFGYGLWQYFKQRRFPEVLALSDSDSSSRAKQFNFIADVVEKASPAVVYIEIKGR